MTFGMAAMLYTSQVPHTRRFDGESPLSSLKLLQDRRTHTADTIVISDDESGAIHEESDLEDDDCACADDHTNVTISSGPVNGHVRYRVNTADSESDHDTDPGDHLLQIKAEILSNGNGLVTGADRTDTTGPVHPSDAQYGDWTADCSGGQTPPREHTHKGPNKMGSHNGHNKIDAYITNKSRPPRIIIDDFGIDNHTGSASSASIGCLISTRVTGNGECQEKVVSRAPHNDRQTTKQLPADDRRTGATDPGTDGDRKLYHQSIE